jgi:hypothetical protein
LINFNLQVHTNSQDAQTMCEILDLIRAELKRTGHYAHASPPEDSPPHPAALIPPASLIPPATTLPLLSPSSLSPSLSPSIVVPHSQPLPTHYYREKIDANSLEGELFSNCGILSPFLFLFLLLALSSIFLSLYILTKKGMSQHTGMVQGLDGNYSFVPFQDLSSMFASQ